MYKYIHSSEVPDTASQSDYDLLCKYAGTDTWIKVKLFPNSRSFDYINIIGEVSEDGTHMHTVPAKCVEDVFMDNSRYGLSLEDEVFKDVEIWDATKIEVVKPVETLSTQEIRSELLFNGYDEYHGNPDEDDEDDLVDFGD